MTLYLVTFPDQSASCVAKMYVRITTGYAHSLIQPLSPIHEHLLCLSVSFVSKGKEVKSVYEPNGSTGRRSTKGLRVFLLALGWNASPSHDYPPAFVHLHWERHRESTVLCPRTERNAKARTPAAQFGGERTTTRPPHLRTPKVSEELSNKK